MKNAALLLALLFLMFLFSAPLAHAQTTPLDVPHSRALRMLEPVKALQAASVVRPLEITHLYQQDLNWINETRTRNEFVDGLLWQQHQDTWEGEVFGEWKETGVTVHGYAGSGGMLSETTTYEIDETGMTALDRTTYAYEGGVYSQITTQVYEGSDWVNAERTSFTVSGGQITGGATETWAGAAWTPSERFTLLEEESGVVETYQSWSGTEWVNTERSTYAGLTIAQLYELMERLMTELAEYEGMYYSLRGFPDVLEQQWEAGAWTDVSRQTTERYYDLFTGRVLKEVTTNEEWAEEEWTPSVQTVVDYAQMTGIEGMPAKTSFQVYDGEAWADLFVEKYIIQNDIKRIVQATVETDLGEGLQETSRVLIDWTVVATDAEPVEATGRFELGQNAPNPFTHSTEIAIRLAEPQHVRLAVYDLLGREVVVLADGHRSAGEHRLRWEAADMPSGVYLYRVEAGSHAETRRMVLVK